MPDEAYEGPFKFSYPDDYGVAPGMVWLVEGVLPKGGIVLFYGPPKSGKTYVAVSWVGCVQSGQMWAGLPVKQADCVYLALEGHNGIVRRHIAWKQVNGVHRPTRTALVRESVNMADMMSVDRLLRAFEAQACQPGLIVVDTYQRASGESDIISQKDNAKVLTNVDRLRVKMGNDPTILFVSHTRKNDANFLGAQTIFGWVDGMITLVNKGEVVELQCDGFRDGEAFSPIPLRFETTVVNTDRGPQTDRAIVGRASFIEKLIAEDKTNTSNLSIDKEAIVAAMRATGAPMRFTDLKNTVPTSGRLTAALNGLALDKRVAQMEGTGHRPYTLVGEGDGLVSPPFSLVSLVGPPKGGTRLNQKPNLVCEPDQTRPKPNSQTKLGSLLGDAISSTIPQINHNVSYTPHTPDLREALADEQPSNREPNRVADRTT